MALVINLLRNLMLQNLWWLCLLEQLVLAEPEEAFE